MLGIKLDLIFPEVITYNSFSFLEIASFYYWHFFRVRFLLALGDLDVIGIEVPEIPNIIHFLWIYYSFPCMDLSYFELILSRIETFVRSDVGFKYFIFELSYKHNLHVVITPIVHFNKGILNVSIHNLENLYVHYFEKSKDSEFVIIIRCFDSFSFKAINEIMLNLSFDGFDKSHIKVIIMDSNFIYSDLKIFFYNVIIQRPFLIKWCFYAFSWVF